MRKSNDFRSLLRVFVVIVLTLSSIGTVCRADTNQPTPDNSKPTPPTSPPGVGNQLQDTPTTSSPKETARSAATDPSAKSDSLADTPPIDKNGNAVATKNDATKYLTVDLSVPSICVRDAGKYTLRFVNRLPTASYTISSRVVSGTLPPALDMPTGSPPTPAPSNKNPTDEQKCANAIAILKASLYNYICEAQVASLVATYRSQLTDGKCKEQDISKFGDYLSKLVELPEPDPLPALTNGDVVEIQVTRAELKILGKAPSPNTCSADSRTIQGNSVTIPKRDLGPWQFNIGKLEAQWLTFYGFNFAPGGNEDYFSKTNSGTDPITYTVTRKASNHGSAFSPSVYFVRVPGEDGFAWGKILGWRSGDTFGGVAAGLGFDFDNPTIFLGYGISWGYNVMLTTGVVMHKENRLNGQYTDGQTIAENLTSAQLTEATYKPRVYIGLAFRFSSNPFKSSSNGSSTADTSSKSDSK